MWTVKYASKQNKSCKLVFPRQTVAKANSVSARVERVVEVLLCVMAGVSAVEGLLYLAMGQVSCPASSRAVSVKVTFLAAHLCFEERLG